MHLYPLIRPLTFALDAETAHRAAIKALKLMPPRRPPDFPASLKTRVAGIDFATPIGLAAGFDKDAEVPEQMLSFGFGFVEVGTLTPRAQEGNSRPRLFRLSEDHPEDSWEQKDRCRLGQHHEGQNDAKSNRRQPSRASRRCRLQKGSCV